MMILRGRHAVIQPVTARQRAAGGPGGPARHLLTAAAVTVVAVVCLLTAAACAGPGGQRAPDHGLVLAHLTIPFRPATASGKADLIQLTVKPGQRFSIKIDTSDGPYDWSQVTAPDPRIARLAGNFDDGSCAPGLVGCRVPYFHTLIARTRGTTMMSWKYHDLRCEAAQAAASPPSRSCPTVTLVTFDITVR